MSYLEEMLDDIVDGFFRVIDTLCRIILSITIPLWIIPYFIVSVIIEYKRASEEDTK